MRERVISDAHQHGLTPRATTILFVALIATLLGGCAHRATPKNGALVLDGLLGFSNPKLCELTERHERFFRALWVGDTVDEGLRPGTIDAPQSLRRAFQPVTVTRDKDYWLMRVDVSGTLLGLPLIQITHALPAGGDPGDVIYTFDAPISRAEAALRAAGFPAKANETVQLASYGYDRVMYLMPDDERPEHTIFGCALQ